MKKEWYCTDSDCMQHYRELGGRKYEFIQAIWLDTCEDDSKAKNRKDDSDNYVVVVETVDMNDFNREDIELEILPYYESIEKMEQSYEMKVEELDSLVAEYIFENMSFATDCQSDIVSWNDAEKIINSYKETGSMKEFGKDL